MQAVPGDETKLVFDADVLIVPAGVPEPLNGNPVLSKGLHHRQAVDVFDGRAGQCLLSPVAHRSGAGALTGQCPAGQRRTPAHRSAPPARQAGRKSPRTAGSRLPEYNRLPPRHHLHTLEFQRAQFRGERRQNVPRLFLAKYPRDTRFSTSPSSIRCSATRSVPMLS